MNLSRAVSVPAVNVRLCLIEVFSNPGRTLLTSLGIFLGVAGLLINLSFIRGMDNDLKHNMEMIGGLKLLTVRSIEAENLRERLKFQRSPGLTVEELQKLSVRLPNIEAVMPFANLRWRPMSYRGRQQWGRVLAVSRHYAGAHNYVMDAGRWFTREEAQSGAQVCVVGPDIAERLFGDTTNPVGRKIVLESLPFTVVGRFATEGIYDHRGREVIAPYSVYEAHVGGHRRSREEIRLLLRDSEQVTRTQRDLRRLLIQQHRGAEDFEIEASSDRVKEMRNARKGFTVLLWCIAAITLLVGGISIMNIMFATIGERIREIGTRKALGARASDVFVQFIFEASLVCLAGGLPGMLLGTAITLAPEGLFPYEPELRAADYVVAMGFTVAAGVISGLFPALHAAGMEPVEALAY